MRAGPHLIGIAGPSCSGKSTVAHAICDLVRDAVVVSTDSYYHDLGALALAQRAERNFDDPDAIDHGLLAAHLNLLLAGCSVEVPCYDFATHTRAAGARLVTSHPFVLVEGLYVLHWPEVREQLDLGIFLDADHETCLRRRIERDVLERGRDEAFVIAQYERDVRPMCDSFLLPSARYAGEHLDGTLPLAKCVAQAERIVARRFLCGSQVRGAAGDSMD